MTSTSTTSPLTLFLSGRDAAALLGFSKSAFYRMNLQGLVPRARRFGRLKKWSRAELIDWDAAGSPTREEWERRS